MGVAGITGAPRGRTWDVTASAHAPDLSGDTVTFVTLADGTVLVDQEEPDGSVAPLADAIERTLEPPYRAAGVRGDRDVWTAAAEKVAIAELPGVEGDVVDLSVVGGARELQIEGEPEARELPELDALAAGRGDVALHAERIDGDTFAVDVFPL